MKPRDVFVIATERDCQDPFHSGGAIVQETYLGYNNASDTFQQARTFSDGRYGKAWVCKPVVLCECRTT